MDTIKLNEAVTIKGQLDALKKDQSQWQRAEDYRRPGYCPVDFYSNVGGNPECNIAYIDFAVLKAVAMGNIQVQIDKLQKQFDEL